ncbi:MAG: hypothetical protein KGL39_28955 [Patescibacteria group bacterium]|nr:hypothetical protein [Patescibacteria group bacterium]
MNIDEAFRAGLALVQKAGLAARGTDVQVIAAHDVFTRAARPVEHDARFPADGPRYAMRIILEAYARPAVV